MATEKQDDTLNIYDLDGTLSQLGIKETLEQRPGSSMEIQTYFMAAMDYICKALPELKKNDVYDGVKAKALQVVLPNNGNTEYWGRFSSVQNKSVPICPAVDHFLVTASAATLYLQEILVREGEESLLGQKIKGCLSNPEFTDKMFLSANAAAINHSKMDEVGIEVIDRSLSRNALAVVMSNSSNTKASTMLDRAGFGGRIVNDRAQRGKIGVVGSAMKWQVDEEWRPEGTKWGNSVDLSKFHGNGAALDLRRRKFHDRVRDLVNDSGASGVTMASDIVELDLLPLANWPEFSPQLALRTNSNSVAGSTRAAVELCEARVGENLAEILREME